jgi:uncharacterized coiled-coil DUF342 family protein
MSRKTETEFLAEIDELDKAQRYALAMQRATREALRARSEEERLSAELAQTDATIKVLTEALDQCRMRAEELPPGLAAVVFAALRLAGVLK